LRVCDKMDWLDTILAEHKEYESPTNFWYWGALTAVSAVMKDSVWIDRGGLFDLYPNIYTIFYADSGLKKGPPIAMARKLVKLVNNTKIISGRSSIQGILKELSAVGESQPGGNIRVNKAHGFICSSELSASLVADPAALDILTDLYDRIYHTDGYDSTLKQEKFILKDPTIQLLGGINEAHADQLFGNKDIKGGYIGRSFIIHETERGAINSLIYRPELVPDYTKAANYLKEVSKLKGPFATLEGTNTGRYFHEWYHDFVSNIQTNKIKDPTGTLNRFSESVVKVAMLVTIARHGVLTIPLNAMEEAISRCETLVGNVRRTTLGAGKSTWAQEKALLIQDLLDRENHKITREQVNKKYWMRATAAEWDDIAESLQAAGIINIVPEGNVLMFVMPPEQVRQWTEHLKGK
jgi:hypothetical protein